ncbi:MAG: hypothetical protein LAO78_11270 [Acidobacteriia bacterium]|nr:hypothetical protein [Terriglobia bacterium]
MKTSEPVPLSVGILIIGSLLWDERRQSWRKARLNMGAMDTVTAPIRYGRLSSSRGDTYTMVFSRLCKTGQAKLVHCSHSVSTAENLIAEAEHLWKAEQSGAKAHRIASEWGCVALLGHPKRKPPEILLNAWAKRVAQEPDYGNVSQMADEGELISPEGMLRIDWPRCVAGGAPVDLDLLLVTANDPTLTGTPPSYATVETIVNAWNSAAQEHAEYFWKNIDHGITTFQDDEIRAGLRPRQQERA